MMSDSGEYPNFIREKLRWLEYSHHTKGTLVYSIARRICLTAYDIVDEWMRFEDATGVDQLLIGLQRLIDAKDALVRNALAIGNPEVASSPGEASGGSKRKLFVVVSHAGYETATFDARAAAEKVAELAGLNAYKNDDKLMIHEEWV